MPQIVRRVMPQIVRRVMPQILHSLVSAHSGQQQAATWMNTTRHCKNSQVLLMMGQNIAQNMSS